MSFGKLYKYKMTDLTTGCYSQSGNMGDCYLSIAPSRDDVITEYYKRSTKIDKELVEENYDLFKTQIICGKLPNTIILLFKDMAIASLEPQRDR